MIEVDREAEGKDKSNTDQEVVTFSGEQGGSFWRQQDFEGCMGICQADERKTDTGSSFC